MATNLKLFIENSPIEHISLANEVYKVLNQTAKLSAEVVFVSEEEIKNLNKTQRGIDKITDVLSFPSLDNIRGKILIKNDYPLELDDEGSLFLGSIAICLKRANEQAIEYNHSVEREINYLLCHGLLHLFGYDHIDENDKAQMRSLEEQIMTNLRILRVWEVVQLQ